MNAHSSAAEEKVQLHWRRCAHDAWCAFDSVVLPDANASGVVLIWSGSVEYIMYVGQGGIAKILKWARQYEPIATRGKLFVTWATVPEENQNGIRNYLLDRLNPVLSDQPTPDVPIRVNLPWETT
jgi:hypothetical protein